MGNEEGLAVAGRRLEEDWERLVTFYAFPEEHWKHLRTKPTVGSAIEAQHMGAGRSSR